MGQLFKDVYQMWGLINKITTSYHPETNLSERINWILKTMITFYIMDVLLVPLYDQLYYPDILLHN